MYKDKESGQSSSPNRDESPVQIYQLSKPTTPSRSEGETSHSGSPATPKTQPSESPITPPNPSEDERPTDSQDERKPAAKSHQTQESESIEDPSRPRQVIAVSASRGPAAFFNLARKFLVTDEMCDLSALEGAIVSAVDAAHLLERSKLATIVGVQTSYVTVEPKRRKQQHVTATSPVPNSSLEEHRQELSEFTEEPAVPVDSTTPLPVSSPSPAAASSTIRQGNSALKGGGKALSSSGGRELRRARIVITVKRTDSYKQWLKENPLQAIIAGDGDDDDESDDVQGDP